MNVVVDTAPQLSDAMAVAGLPQLASDVIEQVVACYPDDPGVFVAALMDARTLAPGESVYVEPGTVHAYVQGLGVEVMTASDNVLRLGLTSKTVAIDAALAALSVSGQPHPCVPEPVDGVATYAPQGAPFSVVSLVDAGFSARTGEARTVLCLQGQVVAGDVALAPGDAILLEASEDDLRVEADGRGVVARAVSPR
jgi:mannose-6-phosphate isomerase